MNATECYLLLLALFILTCTLNANFLAKQEIQKLMVGHCAPYTLPGNLIPASVDLLDINQQPEYELPSSTYFGQFQKFGKYELGAVPLSHP